MWTLICTLHYLTSNPNTHTYTPLYCFYFPLWTSVWKAPWLNSNFISDLFFSIDHYTPRAAQSGIERGAEMWHRFGENCASRRVEHSITGGEGVRATVLIRLTSANLMTVPVSSYFHFSSENFIRRKLKWIMQFLSQDGWQVAQPCWLVFLQLELLYTSLRYSLCTARFHAGDLDLPWVWM